MLYSPWKIIFLVATARKAKLRSLKFLKDRPPLILQILAKCHLLKRPSIFHISFSYRKYGILRGPPFSHPILFKFTNCLQHLLYLRNNFLPQWFSSKKKLILVIFTTSCMIVVSVKEWMAVWIYYLWGVISTERTRIICWIVSAVRRGTRMFVTN